MSAARAENGDTWINRNYFGRGTDPFTADLLDNVERNHLSQETFWKKYRAGELNYALGDLKYALLVFPNHPRALHLLTMVCKLMQDSTTPIVYFENAIRLYPKEAYTQAQYGAYLLSTGETEPAIARLNEALKLDPNLTYALGLMSEAKKKMGPTVTTGALTSPGQGPSTTAAPSGSHSTTTTPGTTPGTTVR